MQYESMANKFGQYVDSRMMHLEMEAFLLSKNQMIDLSVYCISQFKKIFSNKFYHQWQWDMRSINYDSLNSKIENSAKGFSISCSADVYSDIVYNDATFKKYDKIIFSPFDRKTWYNASVSTDYIHTFEQIKSDLNNHNKCKTAILQLFYEPQKIMHAVWRNHDVSMLLFCEPYEKNDLYRCNLSFNIALATLKDPNCFSEALKNITINSLNITKNLNARVALSPITRPSPCSPHYLYFGILDKNTHCEHPDDIWEDEWIKNYYLPGAEWFNLLSSTITSRIPYINAEQKKIGNVKIDHYGDNVVSLQVDKNIDSIDTLDLQNIRSLLYPTLIPGFGIITFKALNDPFRFGNLTKPRMKWECLPLFEDEIVIKEDGIYFKYCPKDRLSKTGDGSLS